VSDCEGGSLTDSDADGDEDTHSDTEPCARSEHHAAQVCAVCLSHDCDQEYIHGLLLSHELST